MFRYVWEEVGRYRDANTGIPFGLGAARQPRWPQRPPRPPRARATLEEVAGVLQRLPAEIYASKEELEAMTIHELKVGFYTYMLALAYRYHS